MLKAAELVDLLERYERFLVHYAVTVFRMLGDTHPTVERRLLGVIKGSVLPIPIDVFSRHLERLSDPDLARRKATEAVLERFHLLNEVVGYLSAEITDEMALRPLRDSVSKGEVFERGLALATLACLGHADAREALLAEVESMPRLLRWGILTILDRHGEVQWLPLFAANLEDVEPDVARVAIAAVGRTGTASASAKLQGLLNHSSETIVIAAVQTLARLRDVNAIPPLQELARETKSLRVRATVMSAFGDFQDAVSLTVLADGLANPDSRTRANAVLALGRRFQATGRPDEGVIGRMRGLLQDPDHRVRADSFQALTGIGRLEGAEVIDELVHSPQESDRSSGAYLCGKLKLHRFREVLVDLTDDRSWNVRKTAAIALLGLGEPGLVVLQTLMDHGTPDQQVCAAYAIGLADDLQGVDHLLAESHSGSEMSEMATDLLLRLAKPAGGSPGPDPESDKA